MTTIKINIFDNILTQVTKKKTPKSRKKNAALHWRKSQDMNFYQGGKNKIYTSNWKGVSRLVVVTRGSKKSPQDRWEGNSFLPPLKWFSKMHLLHKVRMIRYSKVSKSLCSLLLVFTNYLSVVSCNWEGVVANCCLTWLLWFCQQVDR